MTARLRSLTVRAGTSTVLDEVDLTVAPGTVTALIGESGCGKSMVAAALCGLLPAGTVGTGEVQVAGRTLTPRDPGWATVRGHVVGLVPQSPDTSFTPVRTVRSQVDEIVRILSGDVPADRLAADAGLPEQALAMYPHELSGGMAQRAAVAAATAGAPSVLIADEPTSALDPATARGVLRLLRERADAGAAVLVITHDLLPVLETGCESIAAMRAGRVLVQGPPDDVRTDARHADYLRPFFEELL